MNNCPKCRGPMERVHGEYHFTECGLKNVYLTDWPMVKCGECGEALPILPNPDLITKYLVENLATHEKRLDGDSILFLRKVMSRTSSALAHTLGVNRVQLSRWENDHGKISEVADYRLRMEAVEQLLPPERAEKVMRQLVEMFRLKEVAVAVGSQIKISQHEYRELEPA